MTKKVNHIHNVGDIVTFQFFDGGTYTGKITHQTYQGDNVDSVKTNYSMPTYKIHVDTHNGFTTYPCITEHRIKRKDKTALQASKEFISRPELKTMSKPKVKIKSELDEAIDAQKKFINRNA
tara:strand:+ start:317 stop:682 length:366 start_codon:yes stop_codon:yes gene_type:complete